MPSPFPGMNPYLEQDSVWHSFHEQLMPFCQEVLNAQIHPKYFIKLDSHVYIHELGANERVFIGRPDANVVVSRPDRSVGSAVATPAPVYGKLGPAVDIFQEAFLEIRDRNDGRVVTVIELLSPANKQPGMDREAYSAKRKQYLHTSVNFVEIDLLRGFPKMPVEGLPDCDYHILVSRITERPRVGIWPLNLRDKLPTIPIPLLDPDPDALLDMQALLHRLYDAGGYAAYIYSGTPKPPLKPADAEWAKQILTSAGVA